MSDLLANDVNHAAPGRFMIAGVASLSDEISRQPTLARYGIALFLVALTTGVALSVERMVSAQNVSLFFVIPVVLSATMFGWGESLAAVLAGVLAFDFFFTEPKMSFAIASPNDVWAAGLLFVTASIVSGVAADARRRANEAKLEADRAEALRELAHMIVEGRPAVEIVQACASTMQRLFSAPAVILEAEPAGLAELAEAGNPNLTDDDRRAAASAAQARVAMRSQSYPNPHSHFDFWPVNSRTGRRAVLGVDFTRADRGRPKAVDRSVEVVAAYLSVALAKDPRD